MYRKYPTEALVLRARESGESDRAYTLYTRDLGLIRARASAVRTERSKMRYGLQSLSRCSVSLVRGKRGWRIAGAASVRGACGDRRSISAFARIAELVVRLVDVEERNDYLFAALSESHAALMQERCEAYATIELISVARTLYALGYLSAEALDTALLSHTSFDTLAVREGERMRAELLRTINSAMAETQL